MKDSPFVSGTSTPAASPLREGAGRLLWMLALLLFCAGTAGATESFRADSTALPTREHLLGEVSVTAIKGGDHPNADETVTYIGNSMIESLNIVNLKQAAAKAPT